MNLNIYPFGVHLLAARNSADHVLADRMLAGHNSAVRSSANVTINLHMEIFKGHEDVKI